MHCTNRHCFEDTCRGECHPVDAQLETLTKELEQNRLWPWYRYEDTKKEVLKDGTKKRVQAG